MPRFDALGVVVSDLDAAVAFYRLLGFEFPDTSGPHVEAGMGHGLRLMLDTEEIVQSFSDWTAPTGSGRVGLAMACDSPSEVDDAHAGVIAAGYRSHVDPFDAPWGQRYASVLDPDGTVVDLFAELS